MIVRKYFPKSCTEVISEKGETISTPAKKRNFDFRMSIHIVDRMKDFISKHEKKDTSAKSDNKDKEKEKDKDKDSGFGMFYLYVASKRNEILIICF